MSSQKTAKTILLAVFITTSAPGQSGFNYYKNPAKVGSPNEKAFTYFKKAYYDHIWKWSRSGADSAEYYLKLAIKEDSLYGAAYAFLGHVYQFQTYDMVDIERKFALEKKYAGKAMRMNPRIGDSYTLMADVKWQEQDTIEALRLLRKAVAIEPDHVGNLLWIALRFSRIPEKKDSAIYFLHKLIKLDPEYGQAYMKLANVYESINNLDSAKFYYRKTIHHYKTVKPRDARMMSGYCWLAGIYAREEKYDSAILFYNSLLNELEPSDFYAKDIFLSFAYKGLYTCQGSSAKNSLNTFIQFSEKRLQKNPNDTELMFVVLEDFMSIDQDSIAEKYALPIARKLKVSPTTDVYVKRMATYYESRLLRRLHRNREAIKSLQAYLSTNPKEPLILFELGRLNILENNSNAGLDYLWKAKLYLNDTMTKADFQLELRSNDFDKVSNDTRFKTLAGF